MLKTKNTIFVFLLCFPFLAKTQSGLCTGETPFYEVNLVGSPGGTWVSSPPIPRAGSCCGSQWPERCIEFEILLDSNTVAINFEVASGAIPPGALFYKIGCGPEQRVGEPICVNGPGPHVLTFCKPGKNLNTYAITAIPAPGVSPDSKTSEGCNTRIGTVGLLQDVQWRDLTGDGLYDSYLDCMVGCDTVTVTPQPGYPEFVDYEVCGTPQGGPCSPVDYYCDTVRVYFVPPLTDSIFPNPAIYCQPDGGIDLTGFANGGQGPYTYIWTDPSGTVVDTNQTIFADQEGDYQVEIRDVLYPNCPAKYITGNVSMVLPPVVDAGEPVTICASNPTIDLNGTVQNANTVQWLGSGTFSSDDTILVNTYTPTQSEINAGKAVIYLAAEDFGTCDPVVDSIIVTINPALDISLVGDNILCFESTQDLNVEITGGTPGYSILWNNGVTDSINPNLEPGTYAVTVTDQSLNTCSQTQSITVTEAPKIIIDLDDLTQIFCDNTSPLTVSALGGSGTGYTYTWNTGETGSSITVSPGEYVVTATDGSGCSAMDTTLVQATNSDLDFTFRTVDNLCFGTATNVTPIVTGGFTPIKYLWDDGSTNLSNTLNAGTHCLEVTDNLGCIVNKCITINEDALLEATIIGDAVICKDSSANLEVSVSGGQAPYTYLWQDNSTSSVISGLAGNYSVTVTDANTNVCNVVANFTLNESTALQASLTSSDITCPEAGDGAILVSASGSEGGYNYLWDNGITSTLNSGLDTGWYSVTITDQIGCSVTDSLRLFNPDSIVISLSNIQNVSCFGLTDGSAMVSAAGGTGVYTYLWSSGETMPSATNLDAGINTISVSDGNGCIVTESFLITEPTELISTISSSQNLSCYQSNDGEIQISTNGGTLPYVFNWSPSISIDSTAYGLSAGSYNVNVSDANGCSVALSSTIIQPAPLTSVLNKNNDVLCYGDATGSATVDVFGGTLPHRVFWADGTKSVTNAQLDSGKHVVRIEDAQNCVAYDSLLIDQPAELLALTSPDGTIDCDSTTDITASASGGTPHYSFLWSTGATNAATVIQNSGSYLVVVTDDNGCRSLDTLNIFPLNSTLEVAINGPAHICQGTSTILTSIVTPGVAPFTYEWEDGSTSITKSTTGGIHTVTVTDSVGCVFTASKEVIEDAELVTSVNQDTVCYGTSDPIIVNPSGGLAPYSHVWSNGNNGATVNLGAGNYEVYTTDSTGCKDTAKVTIIENGPYDLVIDRQRNVSCFGLDDGWGRVEVQGGFSPFTYEWSNNETNSYEQFDLVAGTYTVKVTDVIGCKDSINILIEEPDSALKVNLIKSDISCNGINDGAVTAEVSGGYAPYSYLWWETNDSINSQSNLSPGRYNLSVLDSGECVVNGSITIIEPSVLEGYTNVTNVNCYGENSGKAVGTGTGGTTPYSFNWSNGQLDTNLALGLIADDHQMYLTDANGCMDTVEFLVNEPDSLSLNFTTTNVNCYGENSGSLIGNVTGGTPIYSYIWDNSAVTSNTLSGLSAGVYGLTVKDNKQCELYRRVTVAEPDELLINVAAQNPQCYNTCDGIIDIQTSGGVYPYDYSIGGINQPDSLKEDVCPGNYTVIATDANDCQAFELSVQITAPDTFKIDSIQKLDLLCKEICNGEINIFSDLGATDYKIEPGNGFINSPNFTALCDGVYNIYVRNSNGCLDSLKDLALTAPPLISYTIPKDTTICVDGTATFELNASGGFGNLKTFVNGTDTNSTGVFNFNLSSDTILNFTILDENKCSPLTPIIANVTVRDSLQIAAFDDMTICAQDSAMLFGVGSGGDGNLSFSWERVRDNTVISTKDTVVVYPLKTTQYLVTLNDGCETPTVSDTVSVEVLELPEFTINQSAANYCAPTKIYFDIESTEINGYILDWRLNNLTVSNNESDSLNLEYIGNYDLLLNMTSPQGCNFKYVEDSFINVFPLPKASIHVNGNTRKISDPVFTLTNESENYSSITWLIDNSEIFTNEVLLTKFDSVGCYPVDLIAYSAGGCSDTINEELCVEDIFQVFVPNGFTPNGDGINDGFIPVVRNIDASTFKFWVFNRWGENIYYSEDMNAPWNGRRNNNMRECQIDVYVWVFQANDVYGFSQYEVGTISLVR